ncbi:MAG: ABC transporter permease [Anaerolineaceae bacterium]|nr:ABC transporter permease [Anaerolineaceae bacterium]
MTELAQTTPTAGTWPQTRARPRLSLWRLKGILFGAALVLLLATITLAAPRLSAADPLAVDPTAAFSPPSWGHPMGTDNIGRDVWARFLYGGRISLLVGVVAMAISSTAGTLAGILAGYYGGWVDSLLSWLTEVLMAFPGILLALMVIAVLGPGLLNVMVAVGIGSMPSFMRMSRSTVLQVRQLEYVEAARSIGCPDTRLLFRHILPNILRPLVMLATLGIGGAILEGAALNFLGLGAQPPAPEWGSMLSSGRAFLNQGWWISIFPGLGIFLAILGINLLGDGLNEIFDPRARH